MQPAENLYDSSWRQIFKQWNIQTIYIFFNRKKNRFTIEIVYIRPIFGRKFNFRVNIWEQTTEKEKHKFKNKNKKTNGFW